MNPGSSHLPMPAQQARVAKYTKPEEVDVGDSVCCDVVVSFFVHQLVKTSVHGREERYRAAQGKEARYPRLWSGSMG